MSPQFGSRRRKAAFPRWYSSCLVVNGDFMLATQLWSAVSSPSMCFTFDMHDHCRSFNAASNNTRSWLLSNVIQQEFLFFSYDSHLSYLSCDCYLSFEKLGMSKLRFVERNFRLNLRISIYILISELRSKSNFRQRQFRRWASDQL